MIEPYRQYQITLETVGPVFIGSGNKLSKKSYIFSDKNHIEMVDLEKMYQFLKNKGLESKYEQYLMSRDTMKLGDWLKRNRMYSSICYIIYITLIFILNTGSSLNNI